MNVTTVALVGHKLVCSAAWFAHCRANHVAGARVSFKIAVFKTARSTASFVRHSCFHFIFFPLNLGLFNLIRFAPRRFPWMVLLMERAIKDSLPFVL